MSADQKPYDGHTYAIDGPVWTDADRDELVRKLKIIMAKEIDLHIDDRRVTMLALALLGNGYKRTVRS